MPENRFATGRHAGALVPLFSIASRSSWGIGEIPDLPRFARWLSAAGLSIIQLLPVNEIEDGQSSPYSAMSAMAIDPIYISVGELEEFASAGGEDALSEEDRAALEYARSAPRINYVTVRSLKSRALRAAFRRFEQEEWRGGSTRAAALGEFVTRECWWLEDYALFRALHHENSARYWMEWDEGIRNREPQALESARRRLASEILFRIWLQWVADSQWQRARRECARVGLFGDFPFGVSRDSADVWARQREFRLDASVGVPPDAFSEKGQDWGLPLYGVDVTAAGGHEWLRHRARRCAELYDGFRVDHLVGFYRTFYRQHDGHSAFVPADEPSQIAQGEQLLRLFVESGARIIAEDLGLVPDTVRASLARMRVPGLKVLRWEREWKIEGQPFRDPATYPAVSVAMTGTHDTETLAGWWDAALPEERAAAAELPTLRDAGCNASSSFTGTVHESLLEAALGAASDLTLLPVQDIFGWRERVNTPAVTDDRNWTWRLPWPVDLMITEPQAIERARFLRGLAQRHGRVASERS